MILEPLRYHRPAASLRNPWSDVSGECISVSATIVPTKKLKYRVTSEGKNFRGCDARGLQYPWNDHKIASFCEIIGDVAKATTVPAPNIRENENSTTKMAKSSTRINVSTARYRDLGTLMATGRGKVTVGIRGAARHFDV
jgi:hypothetical protein